MYELTFSQNVTLFFSVKKFIPCHLFNYHVLKFKIDKMTQKKGRQAILIILCAVGSFAIAGQFYLIIENRTASVIETIIRFFSFFTILTNILVAACCGSLLQNFNSKWKNFFSKQTTITPIAVYITIVGIVYNVILRPLWKPEGFQWVINELLHTVIPLLFVLFWFIFIPRGNLQWKSVLAWLLYPFLYLLYALIRGTFSGFYPYPFIDIAEIGYNKTFINSGGMLVAFLVVSILFVLLNRLKKF
jgi:hypothetical protein